MILIDCNEVATFRNKCNIAQDFLLLQVAEATQQFHAMLRVLIHPKPRHGAVITVGHGSSACPTAVTAAGAPSPLLAVLLEHRLFARPRQNPTKTEKKDAVESINYWLQHTSYIHMYK